MNLYSLPLSNGGQLFHYLSLLDPASGSGFTPKAIVGYLTNPSLPVVHSNITYNPDFIDLFHKIIVLTSLRSKELETVAEHQQNGFIYIVDQRNSSKGNDLPEDIVGSFEVHSGSLQPMSYQPNLHYQMISASGMFRIPGDFDQFLELAILSRD